MEDHANFTGDCESPLHQQALDGPACLPERAQGCVGRIPQPMPRHPRLWQRQDRNPHQPGRHLPRKCVMRAAARRLLSTPAGTPTMTTSPTEKPALRCQQPPLPPARLPAAPGLRGRRHVAEGFAKAQGRRPSVGEILTDARQRRRWWPEQLAQLQGAAMKVRTALVDGRRRPAAAELSGSSPACAPTPSRCR